MVLPTASGYRTSQCLGFFREQVSCLAGSMLSQNPGYSVENIIIP